MNVWTSGLRWGALVALVLGAAVPAAAQDDLPRAQVSVGYQFLKISNDDLDEAGVSGTMAKGWYADVSAPLTPMLAAVFQIGGNYKSDSASITIGGSTTSVEYDLDLHNFLGGARYTHRRNPAVVPFAQVLAGVSRVGFSASASVTSGGSPVVFLDEDDSDSQFAMQFGGGVDLRMSTRIGVRFAGDYMRIFVDEGGVNTFRLAAGIVFPFSR